MKSPFAPTPISGYIAYLQGGLGNQLFIYAAALQLSARQGVPLFVDVSFYKGQSENPSWNVTPREYELVELNLPGFILNSDSPWYGSSPQSRKKRVQRRLLPPHHKVFLEQSTSYDPSVNSIKTGTTLCGYFQAAGYLNNSVSTVLESLENHYKLKNHSITRSSSVIPTISFHIRRGDYLDGSRNPGQVITSWRYFEEALDRASEKFGHFEGKVYTDSPELIEEQLKKYPELRLVDSSGMSPLELMLDIADADGIVMSNSSLSWWAARLLQHIHSSEFVIAPRPWHGNGNPDEMYLPGWIIQDA